MRVMLRTGTPAECAFTSGARTGLVLIPDIGGLRPLFDQHVARLAREWGVSVCAPEPFPARETLAVDERLTIMKDRDDGRVLTDVRAAADHLGCERTVVTGFCMGGMYALKAAAEPRFERAVSFYGMIRLPDDWKGPGQAEPLHVLKHRRAGHVLAIIGTEDPWVSVSDGQALKQMGAEVAVYPGAEHGFVHDPARPAHRPFDAADAWQRAKRWLVV